MVYRLLHLERGHEVGRARLRHAGIHARHADFRADGALYGLPLRASNACAANAPDAQAAWESAFSLWACVTAKANVVYHSAGWLEGGLIASYEKFVMDCETLQQVMHYMKPVPIDAPSDIAVDAIREVGPRGHFFGAEHTQARYETAFYTPVPLRLAQLREPGRRPARCRRRQRANRIWKADPRRIRAAAARPGDRGGARDFVERRKREGGAPTDF